MAKKESKKRPRNDDGGRDGSGAKRQVRLKDSEVFTRLQQFERQIDEVLRLTRIDYNATRASPKTASLTPRIPKILRLQVKTELRHAKDEVTAPALPKEWSITLTGQLVDRTPGSNSLPATQREHAKQLRRMSDVVQRVVIKLDRDHEPPGTSVVEWTRPIACAGASSNDARSVPLGNFDGLAITRKVLDVRPFDVDILVELRFEPARFKLSGPLRKLLGIHTETRQRVIKAFYEHCKNHRLFDKTTGAIIATPEIAAIFLPPKPKDEEEAALKEEPKKTGGAAGGGESEVQAGEGAAAALPAAKTEVKKEEGEADAAKSGGEGAAKQGSADRAGADGVASTTDGAAAAPAAADTAAAAAAAAPPAEAAKPIVTHEQISDVLDFHLSAPDVIRLRQRVELLPPPVANPRKHTTTPHHHSLIYRDITLIGCLCFSAPALGAPATNPECRVDIYQIDLDLDGERLSAKHILV